jgi:hypothetical protein
MRLAVHPLREMSPLSGEPRQRFTTGPVVIAQHFDNGTLPTSKDNLGLGLNELGIGLLGLPASTLALSLELQLEQSFPTSDESLPTL